MKRTTRLLLLISLLTVASLSLPNHRLAAQSGGGATEEQEAPETFVPTEKLPADAAVSFPIDI